MKWTFKKTFTIKENAPAGSGEQEIIKSLTDQLLAKEPDHDYESQSEIMPGLNIKTSIHYKVRHLGPGQEPAIDPEEEQKLDQLKELAQKQQWEENQALERAREQAALGKGGPVADLPGQPRETRSLGCSVSVLLLALGLIITLALT